MESWREIAVEMTAQWERKGEKVESLVLIDTSLTFDEPMEQMYFDLESEAKLMKSKFDFLRKI